MAFIGMVFVALVIFILMLFAVGVVGLILLVVGLVKRKRACERGKKYPYVLIALGSFMLSIPVFFVGSVVVSVITSEVKLNIERQGYNNCIDKWKNEWVSSEEVKEDIMTELFAAAEIGDKEAVRALFVKSVQDNPKFDSQLDEFLKEFPKGVYWKPGTGSGSQSGSYEEETTYVNCMVYRGEERYYVSFSACNDNKNNKDEVGLEHFYINSEKAEVLEDEPSFEGYAEDEYIAARIKVEGDFETRLIGGWPYKFYPADRVITKQQALDAVRKAAHRTELKELLGEPNSDNATLNYIVYEIQWEDDESLYMVVSYGRYGEIILSSTRFENESGDKSQWLDDKGNIITD